MQDRNKPRRHYIMLYKLQPSTYFVLKNQEPFLVRSSCVSSTASLTMSKLFKLNVGGTRFEVSDSLLDQFPDSMLRRLTSEAWNREDDAEIFIERNGQRFQYVLDFMRDSTVALPLAIPRAQFVLDLEYYNIDYEDSKITLGVADPKDFFINWHDTEVSLNRQ